MDASASAPSATTSFRYAGTLGSRERGLGSTPLGVGESPQLYDAGMKGAEITQIMGWKDPTTYLNYVHEVPKETEEKLERLHPYFSGGSVDGFDKAKAVVEEVECWIFAMD